MNPTNIEWTDKTVNPLTGCWGPGGMWVKPKRCPYCFAHRMSKRLRGMGQFNYRFGFEPTYHPHVVDEMAVWVKGSRKPKRIFVCSMGDLWHPSVPREYIEAVLAVVRRPEAEKHTWQFLTKNPERYAEFSPFPASVWVGASATDQASWDHAAAALRGVEASVRFISAEPLLERIEPGDWMPDWLIIGAQTGPGAKPPPSRSAADLAWGAVERGVPVFIKDNLDWRPPWTHHQQFPEPR